MENCNILISINDSLSLKSQVRLKCVSKTCYKHIIIKNYSCYRIFKKLKISVNRIIRMLYELDNNFCAAHIFDAVNSKKVGLWVQPYKNCIIGSSNTPSGARPLS